MKDFTLYQEAFALKELGFDEPCFKGYFNFVNTKYEHDIIEILSPRVDIFGENYSFRNSIDFVKQPSMFINHNPICNKNCSAPTYSQAFRFFREKFGLHTWVGCKTLDNGKTVYIGNGRTIPNTLKDGFIVDIIPYEPKDTFEEAELACLRKLIEIVKQK